MSGTPPSWELLPADSGEHVWDEIALGAADASVFQSWRWGEYKRAAGWEPRRWVARDGTGEPIALVQILTRRYPFDVRVGWAPGGPLFRLARASARSLAAAVDALTARLATEAPRTYLRFDSYVPSEPELVWAMRSVCARAAAPINTGFSSLLDLRPPPDEILRSMTAKHRYYVRRAVAQPIEWRSGNDADAIADLVELNRGMLKRKQLHGSLALEPTEVARLCAAFGDRVTLLVGREESTCLCACLVLRYGASAFYFAAATGERGRTIGASYALLSRLIEVLRDAGVARLDLGGLDPRSPAAGVNHFKGGFGGTLVEYLGEWEWSSSRVASAAVNLAIRARRIGR